MRGLYVGSCRSLLQRIFALLSRAPPLSWTHIRGHIAATPLPTTVRAFARLRVYRERWCVVRFFRQSKTVI